MARAQQAGAPAPGSVQPDVEQWIRATGGDSEAAANPNSDTRFLASLSEEERQGGFLFRQPCYACHHSALSPVGAGKAAKLEFRTRVELQALKKSVERR